MKMPPVTPAAPPAATACRRSDAFARLQASQGYAPALRERIDPARGASLRCLVVDANESFLPIVCGMLHSLGHETTAMPSAELAMEALARQPADVLLTDLRLPGISGIELARSARRIVPGLRVIFSSGYGYLLDDGLEFEFDLLHKPYFTNQLRQIISG